MGQNEKDPAVAIEHGRALVMVMELRRNIELCRILVVGRENY